MWSETILLILGGIVFLSPFIGIPFSILSWILPLLALGIIALSYQLRTQRKSLSTDSSSTITPRADRTPFSSQTASH